jgi:hypothetical protein
VTATGLLVSSFLVGALPLNDIREGGSSKLWRCVSNLIDRPLLGLGVGITATFALSPLVWSHYLVLLSPIALFCAFSEDSVKTVRILGWMSLLLLSDLPRRVLQLTGLLPFSVLEPLHVLAWVPAWLGCVIYALNVDLRSQSRIQLCLPIAK